VQSYGGPKPDAGVISDASLRLQVRPYARFALALSAALPRTRSNAHISEGQKV